MKSKLLSIIAVLFSFFAFSQGANLDRENFNVSYINLPRKPILNPDKRTFNSNFNMSIAGFTRVSVNGNIGVKYSYNGTVVGEMEIKQTKHEKKDKDGKVISTSYTYKIHIPYSSSGKVNIVNNVNPENNYNKTYTSKENYESKDFNSRYKAQQHYNDNRYILRDKYRASQQKHIKSQIENALNGTYGYVVNNKRDILWILGKKKHPEYAKHMEAYQKAKGIFAKMKSNQPIDGLKAEFQEVIAYFDDVVTRYPGDKKKQKKMRYASYYNNSKIYYYLDQPEKAREYGQKLIDNDYDKKDGKYIINISDKLEGLFEANKTTSRHMEVVTKDESNSGVPDSNKEAEEVSVVKGYLVTSASDTLSIAMKQKNIAGIGKGVITIKYADSGEVVGEKVYTPEMCNELLLLDGTRYKNVSFKDYSSEQSSDSMKLCKLIHESSKLSLYSFNDKEPVFFKAGATKGESTQSPAFGFGFKKSLLKYSGGCTDLSSKIESNKFENNIESLKQFCKDLDACK